MAVADIVAAVDAGGRSLPPICMGKKGRRPRPPFKGAVFQLLVLPSVRRAVGQVLRESIGEGVRPSSAICKSLAVCKARSRNRSAAQALTYFVLLSR